MLILTQSKWTVSEWRPAFLGILNGGPYPEAAPRCGLLLWYSTSSTVQTAPLTFSTRMKHLCKDKLWRTAFLQKVKRALIIHQLKSRPLLGCLKHDMHSILQKFFSTPRSLFGPQRILIFGEFKFQNAEIYYDAMYIYCIFPKSLHFSYSCYRN